jgi:hypothetical protein
VTYIPLQCLAFVCRAMEALGESVPWEMQCRYRLFYKVKTVLATTSPNNAHWLSEMGKCVENLVR